MSAKNVNSLFTVVGGGLSGLTAAYHLAQKLPAAGSSLNEPVAITLVESSNRLGGWVQSERKEIQNGISVLNEKGPRTLRLNGSRESKSILQIIDDLNLHDQVVFTPKDSPASLNKYIYHKGKMNSLPGKFSQIFSRFPPVLRPVVPAIFKDIFTRNNTPKDSLDESISSLLGRRFGNKIDDYMVSAIMAGIYASDTKKLSARMVTNQIFRADRISGKIVTGIPKAQESIAYNVSQSAFLKDQFDSEANDWNRRVKNNEYFWSKVSTSSLISFENGLQTLTDAIAADLKSRKNVNIISSNPCSNISKNKSSDHGAIVKLENGTIINSGKVINTAPLLASKKFFTSEEIKETQIPKIFSSTEYSSIVVVNLTYKGSNLTPYPGFGFLVPRSTWSSLDAIGVVFDSCCLPEQDLGDPITRFTVMMGGPNFSNQFPEISNSDNEKLIKMAIETVNTSLGIKSEIIDACCSIQKECIPLYGVGYFDRLVGLQAWLKTWNGGLSVSGAAYGGPGINSINLHSRDLATQMISDLNVGDSLTHKYTINPTGLDEILNLY
ncbi:Protoporphyrinogen oxidase [Smittium culicis]|uniref:Protoporphyrinogen oxidase n=1 Tax=Smittium culicis TaxID=133412 RepID=A0A1R1X288_9FUNG|nr:Protoporphyrinogen oxidase [Smittium culicis]